MGKGHKNQKKHNASPFMSQSRRNLRKRIDELKEKNDEIRQLIWKAKMVNLWGELITKEKVPQTET